MDRRANGQTDVVIPIPVWGWGYNNEHSGAGANDYSTCLLPKDVNQTIQLMSAATHVFGPKETRLLAGQ